jgi:hypothetical protein
MAGTTNPYGGVSPSQPPTSLFGNPATFTAAANTQASDYDKIMAQYDNLIRSSSTNPITPSFVSPSSSTPSTTTGGFSPRSFSDANFQPTSYQQVAPQTSQYRQSGDVTSSLSKLSDLATTGGYSEADKADIRARDISPIRSIYANAQQETERARALGGGYSPNFNAVTAQMSRDEANKIGDVTTAANAGIAQNVASNRIAAAPAYASASANANAAQTAADQRNADIINQINQANAQGIAETNRFNAAEQAQVGEFNAQGRMATDQFNTSTAAAIAEANAQRQQQANEANANRQMQAGEFNTQTALDAAKTNRNNMFGAIGGQTSLYGTTPALTSTFGNQVMQAGQLGQGQQNINNNRFGQITNLARYGA